MFKLLFYTALAAGSGYALVRVIPDSYKEKMLAAVGWGELKGQTFTLINPAAQREELITQLEENITKIKALQQSSANSKIQIEGPAEVAPAPSAVEGPLVEESEELIEKIKELNPKTGIVPRVMEKILGLNPPTPEAGSGARATQSELQKLINQLSPEAKTMICGVQ